MSHTLAKESQAPETKMFEFDGLMESDITSPKWSVNSEILAPLSTSHNIQVISPLDVKILRSLMNLQQERYPACPESSLLTRLGPSRAARLYIEHILSSPPHATIFPEGAYAQVMTHDDRNGIA